MAATCGACGARLDRDRHAVCEVCDGLRLCLDCAREHLCTEDCEARGCQRGLCTKLVVNGLLAGEYGVPD